jgi:hypothetical protein
VAIVSSGAPLCLCVSEYFNSGCNSLSSPALGIVRTLFIIVDLLMWRLVVQFGNLHGSMLRQRVLSFRSGGAILHSGTDMCVAVLHFVTLGATCIQYVQEKPLAPSDQD